MNRVAENGLYLHASSVLVNGGALLFLGHSTSGKTTISRMLSGTYPILADDTVFAFHSPENCWQVMDGKYRFGKKPSMGNREIEMRPLTAASHRILASLRIFKGDRVRVVSLPQIMTARCLMDAVMEVDHQRKFGKIPKKTDMDKFLVEDVRRKRRSWLHSVSAIARTSPGWNFWFTRNSPDSELSDAIRKVADEALRMWR